MIEIFHDKAVPYQLRSTSNLNLPKVRTAYYGTDTVRFMGQKAWAKLPIEMKTSSSLTSEVKEMRTLQPKLDNLHSLAAAQLYEFPNSHKI